MIASDLRPLMVFIDTRNTGFGGRLEFVVDRLEDDCAHGRYVSVHFGDEVTSHPVADLIDTSKWTFDPLLTAKVMHEKIKHLESHDEMAARLKSLREQLAQLEGRTQKALRPAYPGANHGHSPEAVRAALAAPGLNEAATRAREGLNALADAMVRGDLKLTPDGAIATVSGVIGIKTRLQGMLDPIGELSAVLWFLSSLALDHESLCAIKEGDGRACDCNKPIPDGDEWYERVRLALGLPEKLRAQLKEEKAGREKAEALLKARRTVQVKPMAGASAEGGTLFDLALPSAAMKLLVLRAEGLAPEQMQALGETMRKKFGKELLLFCLREGWELTVLELP